MKKILFIWILLLAGLHSQAQDNIIIPKGQDTLFRVLITPWYGLDPIETKDGNFILPACILKDLEVFNISLKAAPLTRADLPLKAELEKLTVKDIKLIQLKTYESLEPKLIIK